MGLQQQSHMLYFLFFYYYTTICRTKRTSHCHGSKHRVNNNRVQWFYSALEQYSYITVCAVLFKIIGLILMFLLVKEPKDYIIYGSIHVVGSFGSYILNFCA